MINMLSNAYREGLAAQAAGIPEPTCRYTPGTPEYRDFANGYCQHIAPAPLPGQSYVDHAPQYPRSLHREM